jgi:hypothetical protein
MDRVRPTTHHAKSWLRCRGSGAAPESMARRIPLRRRATSSCSPRSRWRCWQPRSTSRSASPLRRRRLRDREGAEHLHPGLPLRPRDAVLGSKGIGSVTAYRHVSDGNRGLAATSPRSRARLVSDRCRADRPISNDDAWNRIGRRSGRASARALGSRRHSGSDHTAPRARPVAEGRAGPGRVTGTSRFDA